VYGYGGITLKNTREHKETKKIKIAAQYRWQNFCAYIYKSTQLEEEESPLTVATRNG